jgi:protease I
MLEGKRIAILVEEGFEDAELAEPMRALRDVGAKVIVVGSGSQKTYKGKRGNVRVSPSITADKIKTKDFDAVVIPGGYAPEKMRLYPSMVKLVKNAFDEGKLVAALCHGPQLLISAEIVRGKRVTSWPSVAIDLKNAGAIWVDEPVVKDGNLITSRKPADIPKFNMAIIEELDSQDKQAMDAGMRRPSRTRSKNS